MGWNRRCVVPKCPRNDPANVKPTDLLHNLPTNDEARKKWVELLGIEGDDAVVHYRNVVCTLHFESERYHSRTCSLLKSYNQTNTCSRQCSTVPKGVFPIRFCPQEIQSSSNSGTAVTAVSNSVNTKNDTSSSAHLSDLIKVVPGKGNEPLSVYLPQSGPLISTECIKHESPPATEIVIRTAKEKPAVDPLALTVPAQVAAPAVAVPPLQQTVAEKKKAPAIAILPATNKPPSSQTMDTVRIPLTASMLLEIANGMETDPEANLKLVWTEHKSIETDTEDLTKMCRMCAKVGLKLTPIFGSPSNELANKINQCMSFQVRKYDTLPLNICLPCERMVLRTHQFYLQCKEANAKLRLLVQKNSKHPHVPVLLPEDAHLQSFISNSGNRHIKPAVPSITPKSTLPEKRKASQLDSCPIPPKMPTYKIILNPAAKPNPAVKPAVQQNPQPSVKSSKRTIVSKYPAVPPGTKTYSIYNFPDPKNLMQLPDYDCRFCPSMFNSVTSWTKHAYAVHSKLLCPVCHSEFENRTEYEHHQVLDHNQAPILHPRYFSEFGNKTCTFCDNEFPNFRELQKHIRERACSILPTMLTGDAKLPAVKRYVCNFCNKVMSKRTVMTEHIIRHVGIKDFACEVCDKRFINKNALMKHEWTHSDFLAAQCEICGASFKMQSYLTQHMQKHNGRWNTKCSCCKLTFRKEQAAEKHFLTHSKASRQKVNNTPWSKVNPFECNLCGKHYKLDMFYLQHMEKHDASSSKFKDGESKSQLCSTCGKRFSNRANLVQHINRLHLPSENFECDICKRVFKNKNSFTRHLMSHFDPYLPCKLCSRRFRGEAKLRSHINRVHIDKKFCCEFCGKAFKLKKHLTVHIRVHTNERPFPCKFCDMAFKQSGDRSKHEANHLKKQK